MEWFAPSKQAAFKAHALICRQESEALAPYREARRVLNAKLATWQDGQVQRSRIGAGQPPDTELRSAEDPAAVSALANDMEPRVEGISFRENWRAEVIDKVAFVFAVASKPELVHLLDANLPALGHLARAQKEGLAIPGVRVWCERIVAASRRRSTD